MRAWAPLPHASVSGGTAVVGNPDGAAAVLLRYVILAPLLEEAYLRGSLQQRRERSLGPSGAIVLVALLFAGIHHESWGFPIRVVAGLVLGWTAYIAGSIWPAVIFHGVLNVYGIAAAGWLARARVPASLRHQSR